jgi:hypothetical protein
MAVSWEMNTDMRKDSEQTKPDSSPISTGPKDPMPSGGSLRGVGAVNPHQVIRRQPDGTIRYVTPPE